MVLNIGSIRIYILMTGRNVEQTKDVRMYIEEFILVDIWIHCCTNRNWLTDELMNWWTDELIGDAWKNTGLYTLATKDWLLWELLLEVYWQVRIE